jgi:hypothetical protein
MLARRLKFNARIITYVELCASAATTLDLSPRAAFEKGKLPSGLLSTDLFTACGEVAGYMLR